MSYACPNCQGTDRLEVVVFVWRRLDQSDPDNVETTEGVDGSEDFDGNSTACCTDCRWQGLLGEADLDR